MADQWFAGPFHRARRTHADFRPSAAVNLAHASRHRHLDSSPPRPSPIKRARPVESLAHGYSYYGELESAPRTASPLRSKAPRPSSVPSLPALHLPSKSPTTQIPLPESTGLPRVSSPRKDDRQSASRCKRPSVVAEEDGAHSPLPPPVTRTHSAPPRRPTSSHAATRPTAPPPLSLALRPRRSMSLLPSLDITPASTRLPPLRTPRSPRPVEAGGESGVFGSVGRRSLKGDRDADG